MKTTSEVHLLEIKLIKGETKLDSGNSEENIAKRIRDYTWFFFLALWNREIKNN